MICIYTTVTIYFLKNLETGSISDQYFYFFLKETANINTEILKKKLAIKYPFNVPINVIFANLF